MTIQFDERLTLLPIPASSKMTARQAGLIQRRLNAVGDIDQIRAEALDAIYNTSQDDEPSEVRRLRLLYRDAYSRDELVQFVALSLLELGFGG